MFAAALPRLREKNANLANTKVRVPFNFRGLAPWGVMPVWFRASQGAGIRSTGVLSSAGGASPLKGECRRFESRPFRQSSRQGSSAMTSVLLDIADRTGFC